ncbi:transcription elongation factor A N-terminal and central domain-containing 2 [Brachionus plicatilis]|uniref:Transcription elongation factor A N-terminal and central domain-containing 2 n=1 Tax=Brachionus plicatilis TaxID=10195 RepID=A0A3M7S7H8_BRAPC|nr:transcription elongation factor A N-terminal and central domain-containing 2 [Brachionus plicatilis]
MGKQLKINELKRVVNVDKFSQYANILKDTSNTDEKQIECILNELALKTPSRDVLMKTKLGFILKEMSRRQNLSKNTREKALNLRSKWKEFHKKILLAPKFDVKCDKPTTENRQKAREELRNSFVKTNTGESNVAVFDPNQEAYTSLISDLEFTIFQNNDKLVNNKYFNLIRKCINIISQNSKLRNELFSFNLKIEDLVNQYLLNGSQGKSFFSKATNLSETASTTSSSENPFQIDELIDF